MSRKALPHHAKDAVENGRDAMMNILAEAQKALDLAEAHLENPDAPKPWAALDAQTRALGKIIRLASFGQRELESIKGMDSPPDTDGIKLINK